MRIDAHQHFWKYDPARDAWITDAMQVLKRDFLPNDLIPEMNACGMDASIAVQADQSEAETLFLLDLAEHSDRIAGVVGWADLRSPQLDERLAFFAKFPKLRGFRHIAQAEANDRFLARADFVHGISRLGEFGFTYDILIYPRQLAAAIELVEKLPLQRFVIDHMAKPEIKAGKREPWAEQMRTIARNANVWCKLSGLVTEADWAGWKPADFTYYLDATFEAFGPERLMFGSDWPVCLVAGNYGRVKELIADYVNRQCAGERAKIFGGNAIQFYGLKATTHGFAA
jgi:L-fuconolactonase